MSQSIERVWDGLGGDRVVALSAGTVPIEYTLLMEELRVALNEQLGIDLQSKASVDGGGMLHGRVYSENPHSGAQFNLLEISHRSADVPERPHYVVSISTERLPGVNEFSKFFPLTRSNAVVKNVARSAEEVIAKHEGVPVVVQIDRNLAVGAGFLIGVQAAAGALLGGMLAFLFSGSTIGALQGALAGGAVVGGVILLLVFRLFD